ncbi:MAG: hypothetical protein SPI36_04135 [Candidatus Onthovivens sp.]|nr:hypothetical protein [Candidatus Onthovivens sp.]
MRKNINTEHIEGRVYQHSLELKESGPNSKNPGTKYISGNLNIAVDEDGMNVITIHFTYVTAVTSKGNKNSTFTTLNKIIDNPENTWITGGKDNAFKVKVDTALALNDFYANDGTLVSAKRNEGGFVSFVNELCPIEDRNTFQMDMVINRVQRVEADEEKGIKEDYLKLCGAVFNFKNDLLPVEFIVKNVTGIVYFENLDISPKNIIYTKIWGHINNQVLKTQKVEESAFGDTFVIPQERQIREWVVTGTAKVPYDFGDESVLTEKELTEAMQNREVYLADVKKRQEEYNASKQASNTPADFSAPVAKNGDFSF